MISKSECWGLSLSDATLVTRAEERSVILLFNNHASCSEITNLLWASQYIIITFHISIHVRSLSDDYQCTVGHDLDKTPLKPKSSNAFGYCRTSFGRCRMTLNLSLAPFRALKMPKKGLKTTKKCLFWYSAASYVTQINFFLQYASSYVS